MLTSRDNSGPKNQLDAYYKFFRLDNVALKLLAFSFFLFWSAFTIVGLTVNIPVPPNATVVIGGMAFVSMVLLLISFIIVGYLRFRYRFTVNQCIAISIDEIIRIMMNSKHGILDDEERKAMKTVFRNLRRSLLRYKNDKLMFKTDRKAISDFKKNLPHIMALISNTDKSSFATLESPLREMSDAFRIKSTGKFVQTYKTFRSELDAIPDFVEIVRDASKVEAIKKIPAMLDKAIQILEKIEVILNKFQSIIITATIITSVLVLFSMGDFDRAKSIIDMVPPVSLPN